MRGAVTAFRIGCNMAHISLTDVTVEFPILDDRSRSLRHALVLDRIGSTVKQVVGSAAVGGTLSRAASGVRIVQALNGLSFDLKSGDRLGLIGHNGSGKTTLLRVLSGIFEPTAGLISISGTTMPLLNINEGMAADATGLEAIRVRGYLLGLSNKEIQALTEDVLEFCELGEFIELPIRTYSSGMMVRLVFAITTAMSTDILLMDEVIGAGDAAFIERAERRLKAFVERASILVVASHSDAIIRQWCNRAILLAHGSMVMDGPVDDVLARYHSMGQAT